MSIVFFSSTRADLGIISEFLNCLELPNDELVILATGTHCLKQYNPKDALASLPLGAVVVETLPINLDPNASLDVKYGLFQTAFIEYFRGRSVDCVVVVGDRFEAAAFAIAAFLAKVKVVHLHGGETSEGSLDDTFRDLITRVSSVHLTSHALHSARVMQIVKKSEYVFNVGAFGVKGLVQAREQCADYERGSHVMVCYHPTSGDVFKLADLIDELEALVEKFYAVKFIFIGSNIDDNGLKFSRSLRKSLAGYSNATFEMNFERVDYLDLLSRCHLLVGNTSSGIIEAPYFNVPFIHIGSRQRGRTHCKSSTFWVEHLSELGRQFKVLYQKKRSDYIYERLFDGDIDLTQIQELIFRRTP